jgi:hypothetical protein
VTDPLLSAADVKALMTGCHSGSTDDAALHRLVTVVRPGLRA